MVELSNQNLQIIFVNMMDHPVQIISIRFEADRQKRREEKELHALMMRMEEGKESA